MTNMRKTKLILDTIDTLSKPYKELILATLIVDLDKELCYSTPLKR